jgi:iron complex transport system substrate-binding protein
VRRIAACWLALALLGTALPGRAQIVLKDDRGATLTLAAPVQRVVSLLPSLTESVCALGACARLVGTDRYSNEPDAVRKLPKLGGLEDAQVERIVALRPDVVLAAPSARVIERLEALGLKVLVLESRHRADVQNTLTVLARAIGDPARADAVWAQIETRTRAAAARVPASARGLRVYFEVDATPYAAGTGSFIGETLRQLGLANIVPAELGPFPKLNPEYVVRAQPDVVMALARNLAEMPRRPGWSRLTALQLRRACGFDAVRYELITRPGPRMGEAAEVLADCLVNLPP